MSAGIDPMLVSPTCGKWIRVDVNWQPVAVSLQRVDVNSHRVNVNRRRAAGDFSNPM